jgi:folate-binding protein YgfZ
LFAQLRGFDALLDVVATAMSAVVSTGYAALREAAAWIDLSGRGKLRVTGEDRARLLHAMCSQDIESMRPGDGGYAFFLNAQGRILADANIFCFEDHFLLDTEPETARKVFEHLDRFIIADDVTLADETETTATLAIEGPYAERVLRDRGAPLPEKDYQTAAWEDGVIAKVSSTGALGFFIFLPVEAKADFIHRLAGLPHADAAEARLVRIENGRPRYGEEITERFLVQETAQLRGVHFSKGCYLGQEIVERVRSRAQIHRVLRRLEIDTAEPLPAGTKLTSGGVSPLESGQVNTTQAPAEVAAEIASSAFSSALGKTVALAYVRTPYAEPGTVIDTGSFKALVS